MPQCHSSLLKWPQHLQCNLGQVKQRMKWMQWRSKCKNQIIWRSIPSAHACQEVLVLIGFNLSNCRPAVAKLMLANRIWQILVGATCGRGASECKPVAARTGGCGRYYTLLIRPTRHLLLLHSCCALSCKKNLPICSQSQSYRYNWSLILVVQTFIQDKAIESRYR